MFIFIQIGADIAYKMTNKTVVDREVLQVVVVSAMSWNSCEEEDLVRVLIFNQPRTRGYLVVHVILVLSLSVQHHSYS